MRKRPTCRLRGTGGSANGCCGRRSRCCMMGAHDGGKPGCLVVGPLHGCCMRSDRLRGGVDRLPSHLSLCVAPGLPL
eukprot:4829895-Prymnesium_polylepis.1